MLPHTVYVPEYLPTVPLTTDYTTKKEQLLLSPVLHTSLLTRQCPPPEEVFQNVELEKYHEYT